MVQLVIAEKPSVARDLARVLGVRPSGKGCFEGKDRVVTWCIGHLVELDEPASYDGRWKAWRMDTLPMVPTEFKLRAVPSTRDQLREVCELLRDKRFSEVINACDAGREGELIFRYVYQLAGSRIPIRRLWISSLTDEAIHKGFAALRPGRELEALADAARCRSEADWLVGLNATRAVTIRHRRGDNSTLFSIGRVQTPTLGILVDREKQIRAFVAEDYWLLKGEFRTAAGGTFGATFNVGKVSRIGTADLALAVQARARAHGAADDVDGPVVESLKQTKTREPPPLLFDLTSLQRTANKRFGLSAKATLEAAQALYERHKILTYPRTDSRHLSTDMLKEMERIVGGIEKITEYAPFARALLDNPSRPGKRVFDDSKISDHHAIIPTGKTVDPNALGRDEQRVFDMVVRRFLGAFYPDAEFAQTEAIVRVGPSAGEVAALPTDVDTLTTLPPPPDRFVARGRVRTVAGWQEVAGFGDDTDDKTSKVGKVEKKKREDEDDDATTALPPLAEGQHLSGEFQAVAKKTKPPSRHTEGTLLSAMENAGRLVEDEALRAAMKDSGLGTPATRAAIIETLLKRAFVVREGKHILPTPMGIGLIEALPVQGLASPELTGQWEARLARIARSEEQRARFMGDIASYVKDLVEAIRKAAPMAEVPILAQTPPAGIGGRKPRRGAPKTGVDKPAARKRKTATVTASAADAGPSARPTSGPARDGIADLVCPACRQGQIITGKRGWGCSRWREGCKFVVWFEEQGTRRSLADLRALVTAS
jgi:DNA topoisomerase-3